MCEEEGMLRLYVKVWYAPFTRRMFSGFRSVWIRLRSWRTESIVSSRTALWKSVPTSNTCKQLPREVLYLRAWERDKTIALEEIKDALAEQVRDDAYVVSVVE